MSKYAGKKVGITYKRGRRSGGGVGNRNSERATIYLTDKAL